MSLALGMIFDADLVPWGDGGLGSSNQVVRRSRRVIIATSFKQLNLVP